ncbi:telomere repeats-binding bouquet formation protein 2-like [Dysidea avara]|uniref:telomere repeats-binding bouquet formation protein 2-like n=1 Tax=Dysidea avara TaxID=196820 RepID=UPI00332149A6
MYADKSSSLSLSDGYMPFKGWTAWFSASVQSSYKECWDRYGGKKTDEFTAHFIFSKDATAKDTFTVHRDQPQVSVFKPEWIHAVVKKGKDMSAVPIGSYFLPPHHVPVKSKTTEVILPIVPEVRIAKATQEETNVEMGFLHIDQLPMPKGPVFEFIAKQNGCSLKKRSKT